MRNAPYASFPLVRFDEPKRLLRCVVRCERPGRAWGIWIARNGRDAERGCDFPCSDTAGPKQHRHPARQIHDGGFDAGLACPSVQDQVDFAPQIHSHMLCRRRADSAKAVGRRSSYASVKFPEELKSDRMSRNAQANRILTASELTTDTWRTPQHQGQRPRPEARCEFRRGPGNLASPASELPDIANMNNDRMARGTALDLVDSRDRRGVGCVGAQSVDRLGGKGNQAHASQSRHGIPNRNGLERVDFRRQGKAGRTRVNPAAWRSLPLRPGPRGTAREVWRVSRLPGQASRRQRVPRWRHPPRRSQKSRPGPPWASVRSKAVNPTRADIWRASAPRAREGSFSLRSPRPDARHRLRPR